MRYTCSPNANGHTPISTTARGCTSWSTSQALVLSIVSVLLICCVYFAESAKAAGSAADKAASKSPSQIIQDTTRQVYRLLVEVEGAIKGGTAFLVSGQRIVVTNQHVIHGGTAYSAGFLGENGDFRRVPLRLLATFPQKDLALLEALDDLPGSPLPLSENDPGLAADLFAIGFPAAADPQGVDSWENGDDTTFFLPSILKGYVSRVLTNRWFSSQLQHQTPIIPGYSGGPLIDMNGVVLAVSSSIHKEANGISYGVLASDVVQFLKACSLPANVAYVKKLSRKKDHNNRRKIARSTKQTKSKTKGSTHKEGLLMLTRGKEYLERGDIVAARLVFHYLLNHHDFYDAYVGLARTYDPVFLNEKNVIGVSGDAEKAQEFYDKALSFGNSPRNLGVDRLPSGKKDRLCNASKCSLINAASGPAVYCETEDPILANR